MRKSKIGALALAICCAPSFVAAQDVTWGCVFDRFSGVTTCRGSAATPKRPNGNLLVSKPNVGLPREAVSDYGERVRVYLGGNGTGYQKFHWQE